MNKVLKIDYCFHSHTYRCGHAYGLDEDYVKEAIAQGFEYYGFSDHGMFNDLKKEDYGRDFSLFDDYIKSINNLKKKYKSKIRIFLGFEFEYDKNHIEFYKWLKEKKNIDYLICGQHFYIENNKAIYYFEKIDDISSIERYKNDLIEAMKTGLFSYIAHPDLFFNRISKVTPEIVKICEEIVLASIKYDVALEVNLGGMRFGNLLAQINGCLPYPNRFFFEIAKKYNAKIVIGIDAHSPNDLSIAYEERNLRFAREFVDSLGLNLIERYRVK